VPFNAFLDEIHANGQYYFPILDPNVYAPNPDNASDQYEVFTRGRDAQAFIRDGSKNGEYYYGVLWSGISAYVDFLIPAGVNFWKDEIKRFYDVIPFDGFWLDVNDAISFATGSLGPNSLYQNPVHVPFALPGDPDSAVAVSYVYPEMFNVTNSTEAASAASALASQSSAYPTPATPTPNQPPSTPTPGVRQVIFPPYAIDNNAVPGNALYKQTLAPNATHGDGPYNSTEYQLHNLYGHLSSKATFQGLALTKPGKRPFVMSRSTFAGTGTFAGHWNGDTASTFGNMYFGITQALQFSIAGIAYTGQETCGFRGNADMELCTRWMQLSSFWPLYRNHNSRNVSQGYDFS
jgi:alpha-glucosidase